MENEEHIVRALQRGVTAAVQQSDNPALPVKYLMVDNPDGTAWSIPADQKWLEIVWLPNNRTGDFLGNERNHRGILRLVLHWPNQATGVYAPLALLGSITRHFEPGMLLSGVQITGSADTGGLIEDQDDNLFPASIPYASFRRGA